MATVWWSANGQNLAQVEQIEITAVAVGGTLSATINSKSVVYTCVTGDTVKSTATASRTLLGNAQKPPPSSRKKTGPTPRTASLPPPLALPAPPST